MNIFFGGGSNITHNFISDNWVAFELNYAFNNTVSDNIIANNENIVSHLFYTDRDNLYYHNDFISNMWPPDSPLDFWDNGYPSGGNFWSDYNGTDIYSGPYQNETGSDGIGDIPYVGEVYPWYNTTDRYPLMNPSMAVRDIGIIAVMPERNTIGQGNTLGINVTTANYGLLPETFNTTLYVDATPIETRQMTLAGESTSTTTFIWNTSGLPLYRNYTISAEIDLLPAETNVTDNTCSGGTVTITWLYDVTGDNYCGIDDVFAVASHFGTQPGDPRWDPIYDLNGDDWVGIDDIFMIAQEFGKTAP